MVRVEEHLELVDRLAAWYARRVPTWAAASVGKEDLAAEGAAALCEAALDYSPAEHGPFDAYAKRAVGRSMARLVPRKGKAFHLSHLGSSGPGAERSAGELVADDKTGDLSRRLKVSGEKGDRSSLILHFVERAIVVLRLNFGWSLEQIAPLVGVTPSHLAAIEAEILGRLERGTVSPGFRASTPFASQGELTSIGARLRAALRRADGGRSRREGKGRPDRYRAVDFERRLIFDAPHGRIAELTAAHGFELRLRTRQVVKGPEVYPTLLGWPDVSFLAARALDSLAGRGWVQTIDLATYVYEHGVRLCLPSPEVSYKSLVSKLVPPRRLGYVETRRVAGGSLHILTEKGRAARRAAPVWPVLSRDLGKPQFDGFRRVGGAAS